MDKKQIWDYMDKRITGLIFLAICLICVGCTSVNIKNNIEKEEKALINQKGWTIRDASITICSFEEKDFFSDNQVLLKAKEYSRALGYAKRYEIEADKYRNSLEPEYRYNPDKFEIAKQRETEANNQRQIAAAIRDELRLLVTNVSPSGNNGIWVTYSFNYKEYVSNRNWLGPYYVSYLYRISPNGKDIIQKDDISLGANLFGDFYQATGKRYITTEIK